MLLLLTSREFLNATHADQERAVKRLLRQRQAMAAASGAAREERRHLLRIRRTRGQASLRNAPSEAAR